MSGCLISLFVPLDIHFDGDAEASIANVVKERLARSA